MKKKNTGSLDSSIIILIMITTMLLKTAAPECHPSKTWAPYGPYRTG